MNKVLTLDDFKRSKRELLLDYGHYLQEAQNLQSRIPKAEKKLSDPDWMRNAGAGGLMRMTNARAEYAIDLLTLNYSAGVELADLREFYPRVLEYWEAYAKFHLAFHDTPDGRDSQVAHLPTQGDGFEQANRLICFGVLLGFPEFMPRFVNLVDYNNPKADGMLERIFAFYVSDRAPAPDECTRHLPYFKTLKIFESASKGRPALMAEYLAEWYHASRREPYYETHAKSNAIFFRGYWSWESAVITYLLDIDDSGYRDAQFYPKDLVDFARLQNKHTQEKLAPETGRVEGGQAYPRGGYWFTPAQIDSRRHFKQGEIMPMFEASSYGHTIWQWSNDQKSN